ncbi:hypothetical protein H4582DRAFT_2084142 [Lactarius indigo]|nr:hypothetical protein H4582DRAFT_2084142 [Lactarius indigo]
MSPRITDIGSDVLLSVVDHVFLPLKLPQEAPTEKAERETNVSLCYVLIQVARVFSQGLSPLQQSSWVHMVKMMGYIYRTARAPLVEAELAGALSGLDIFSLCTSELRMLLSLFVSSSTMFEVSPQASVVTSTNGKLLCSYPGPAVQVSAEIFSNGFFLRELASFLIKMDVDVLNSTATAVKAGSTVREVRESAHPKYITELLVGIFRGFGQPAAVDRITKRIRDEVLWKDAHKPWRRSPLWLVIKVALQTSLDSNMYKSFMLVFHTYILNICIQRSFPSEILYSMRVKIARRLSKLGPAVSDGVYQAVYHAAKNTETLLQNRWSSFQKNRSVSLAWLPEQLDVVSDVTITLDNSRPFLINALHLTFHSYSSKSFSPSHRPRLASTLDFGHLSDGQLAAAVAEDKRTALADFESSVERYLDSWVDAYQHDENAPDVIASYIEQYFDIAKVTYGADPEDNSVMILTVMGLWMALDQLITQQCPLLASYSPEIPRVSFILYSFIAPAPFNVPHSLKSIFYGGTRRLLTQHPYFRTVSLNRRLLHSISVPLKNYNNSRLILSNMLGKSKI